MNSTGVGFAKQFRVRIEEDTIQISFDGRPLINVSDRTIQGRGAVGEKLTALRS
jgi:hypothetical protein